jgi:indole-3-glycerol phosphate synthase
MSILDDIRAHKEQEVAAREAARPLATLIAACGDARPVRRLSKALRPDVGADVRHSESETPNPPAVKLIAEVKRRSPTRGDLRPDADAPALATSYVAAGAAAVSVLTDEHFFHGTDDDLVEVRGRISAPVLRKDFTISSYQIYEARALGADAILLIVSMLSDDLINTFLDTADCLGMDALVEAHTEDEVRRAVALRAPIIGINNRDLATFEVDLGTTERLRPLIPERTIVVSESGILGRADVERAAAAGATAVLVGEALVTAVDPAAKVAELLGLRAVGQGWMARARPHPNPLPEGEGISPRTPTANPQPPTPRARRAL